MGLNCLYLSQILRSTKKKLKIGLKIEESGSILLDHFSWEPLWLISSCGQDKIFTESIIGKNSPK